MTDDHSKYGHLYRIQANSTDPTNTDD